MLSASIVARKRVTPRATAASASARHQLAGQPLALVVVADDDRELGRRRIVGQADVAGDGDDRLVGLVGQRGHEGEVVGAVDLDEVPRVGGRSAPAWSPRKRR